MELKVLVICLIIPLCYASQLIIFPGNLAATLVPVTGANPSLVLQTPNISNPYQAWDFLDSFISSAAPGFSSYVFDVKGGNNSDKALVILYPKKSPVGRNEQWSFHSNGSIMSNISSPTQMYLGVYNGAVVITKTNPPVPTLLMTKPLVCSSVGDPHITPYSTGRTDLFSPGSQQPGTYTLSKTGQPTDKFYYIIQVDQQLCDPEIDGVYCNRRAIIKIGDWRIQMQLGLVQLIGLSNFTSWSSDIYEDGIYRLNFAINGTSVELRGCCYFVFTFPQGSVTVTGNRDFRYPFIDVTVTTTSGPLPTGGVCTKYAGTSGSSSLTAYDFLLSWRAQRWSDSLFVYNSDASWRADNPLSFNSSTGHVTTNNSTLNAIATSACSALLNTSTLATQCASFGVSSNVYYQACFDDVKSTRDPTFSASILDGYAKICSVYSSNTVALPASPKTSTAFGPGLDNIIPYDTTTSFLITSRDVNGKNLTTGGENFVVTSEGPAALTFTIVYVGNGNYNVSYHPSVPGVYNVSISLRSTAIRGSPFYAEARANVDPASATAEGEGLGDDLVAYHIYYNFTVFARFSDDSRAYTGGDLVEVTVTGDSTSGVTDNGDGTYTVFYFTTCVGPFTITVTMNGIAISGSPFSCRTTSCYYQPKYCMYNC